MLVRENLDFIRNQSSKGALKVGTHSEQLIHDTIVDLDKFLLKSFETSEIGTYGKRNLSTDKLKTKLIVRHPDAAKSTDEESAWYELFYDFENGYGWRLYNDEDYIITNDSPEPVISKLLQILKIDNAS